MTTSINNFYELHVNLCMHMNCLKDYLKTIGIRQGNKYFIVTLDGKCWIIDPKTFDETFDEKKCSADNKIKILKGVPKNITKIKIPKDVTDIEAEAFYNCAGITSIMIPDSVTSIGPVTFYGCSSLMSMTIPDNVTSVGYGAFSDCSGLRSVAIGNGVTKIWPYTFSGCTNLRSVTIPDSVTSIRDGAFSGCSCLTSVTISNGVTSIGNDVFYRCTGLKSLIFKGKTLDEVKEMKYYPWGIEDKSIIKAA